MRLIRCAETQPTGAVARLASVLTLLGAMVVLLPTAQAQAQVSARTAGLVPSALSRAIHARFGAGPVRLGTTAPMWITTSTPTARLTEAHAVINNRLGYAVALSANGTTALVGAPGFPGYGEAGAACIFRAAKGSWVSTASPTAALESGGEAVAISADGTTVLATNTQGLGRYYGAAYIFQASSEAGWTSTRTPTATLTSAGIPKLSFYGFSAALGNDGATAVVGAMDYKKGQGAAFIFTAAPSHQPGKHR